MHYDRAASYNNGRRRIILALAVDDFENTQLRYKCAQKRYYCDAEMLYLSSVMLDLSCEDFTRKKLSSRRTGSSLRQILCSSHGEHARTRIDKRRCN